MNCSLKCDRHKYTPCSCVHMEVFQVICRFPIISLSYDREDFLHVTNIIWWYTDRMWPNSTFRVLNLLNLLEFLDFLGILGTQLLQVLLCIWLISPDDSKLLIFIGYYKSPCACEQLSIPWASLRTPRCVGIGILICACIRPPWKSKPVDLKLWVPVSRRNRTVHRWRTCRNRTDQVHRRRPGFRHNPVLFFLFLHPSRHPVGAANQAEISATAEKAEMADVEKWRRLFHSSRVKCPFCQQVSNLGSKLILSNNQSRATLWVLDTCLIVGLLPMNIIFNHGFIVLKHAQHRNGLRKNLMFKGTLPTWNKSELSCVVGALVWFLVRLLDMVQWNKSPCAHESLVLLDWLRK